MRAWISCSAFRADRRFRFSTRCTMTRELKVVLVRHEQAAAHAADGYARATGKVGVCLATSGPGATNLVTGIANAHLDSIPMVAITGQVATPYLGTDAFQEADMVGISRPVTKHNFLVKDIKRTAAYPQAGVLHCAHRQARARACGPSVGHFPRVLDDYEYPQEISMRSYKPTRGGAPPPDREGRRAYQDCQEAADLRGRRRDNLGRARGAVRACDKAQRTGDAHAHGAGRVSRRASSCLWACPACTVQRPRTWRSRKQT